MPSRATSRVHVDTEDEVDSALDVVVTIGADFTTTARPRAAARRKDARRDPVTVARAGAPQRALVVIVVASIAIGNRDSL
jgi:hypothetical protein